MKAIIVFSDYNFRAIIAFLRTIKDRNISFGIIASSNEDKIFNTSYAKYVYSTRAKKELDFSDIKNSLISLQNLLQADEYWIMPSTEALNRYILKNREVFEELNCYIPLVDFSLYQLISDKHSFGSLCRKKNIAIPQEYNTLERSSLPLVAKPKTYFSSNNLVHVPQILLSNEDLSNFMNQYDMQDFYYQEFIGGESYYLLYYFSKNGEITKFSQKNLLQQEKGKSILVAESANIHTDDVSIPYENLFLSLGFFGLVMVEIKYYKEQYFMIEANPRFWGPSQLFVDANLNLFEVMLEDFGFDFSAKCPPTEFNQVTKYFWDDGVSLNCNQRKGLAFYSYNTEQFCKDLKIFQKIEIYSRNDINIKG